MCKEIKSYSNLSISLFLNNISCFKKFLLHRTDIREQLKIIIANFDIYFITNFEIKPNKITFITHFLYLISV